MAKLTQKEIQEKQGEINACKILLRDSDYQSAKHADGAMSDEEYEEMKLKRQAWRDRINELEREIAESEVIDEA